ncbi:hypothetical protein OJAV_G00043950 [Oryzias javanicus]|uniref:Uncharacterized protein n=1 Tax=Oryzias javanicus TaxID=123683 RepID=A0A3S2PQ98_ORYJA|nr:hypothetical protein OJAV_G00043950 [Oryzias javanicus]
MSPADSPGTQRVSLVTVAGMEEAYVLTTGPLNMTRLDSWGRSRSHDFSSEESAPSCYVIGQKVLIYSLGNLPLPLSFTRPSYASSPCL